MIQIDQVHKEDNMRRTHGEYTRGTGFNMITENTHIAIKDGSGAQHIAGGEAQGHEFGYKPSTFGRGSNGVSSPASPGTKMKGSKEYARMLPSIMSHVNSKESLNQWGESLSGRDPPTNTNWH